MKTASNGKIIKIVLAAAVLFVMYRAFVAVPPPPRASETYTPFLRETYPFGDRPAGADGLTARPVRMTPLSTTPNAATPPLPVSADLLPKPVQEPASWGSEFAPKELAGAQLLSAVQSVGSDTVGSSLRNANLSLRADPPIEKKQVSPWTQSSIDSDLWRKSLDC